MGPEIRRVVGSRILRHRDGLRAVYAEAFTGAPWHEDDDAADRYVRRLASDAERPGFVAAVAEVGGEIAGFATAWTTPGFLPSSRSYPQVAAALGPDRTVRWLCGAREVDELAVRPAARGLKLGAGLLDAVTGDVPDGRCWLLTSVRAREALAFYARAGWRQATHPSAEGTGVAVLLGPHHPALGELARPL
jgi:GNAT superfamily N-acetyltransferase